MVPDLSGGFLAFQSVSAGVRQEEVGVWTESLGGVTGGTDEESPCHVQCRRFEMPIKGGEEMPRALKAQLFLLPCRTQGAALVSSVKNSGAEVPLAYFTQRSGPGWEAIPSAAAWTTLPNL